LYHKQTKESLSSASYIQRKQARPKKEIVKKDPNTVPMPPEPPPEVQLISQAEVWFEKQSKYVRSKSGQLPHSVSQSLISPQEKVSDSSQELIVADNCENPF
jgi:hypothetical protein